MDNNETTVSIDVVQGEAPETYSNLLIDHFEFPTSRPFNRGEKMATVWARVSHTGFLTLHAKEYGPLPVQTCT